MKRSHLYTLLFLGISLLLISKVNAQYGPLYSSLRGYDSISNWRDANSAYNQKDVPRAIQILDSVETIYAAQKNFRKCYLIENEKGAMFYNTRDYAKSRTIFEKNLEQMISSGDTLHYEFAMTLRFLGYLTTGKTTTGKNKIYYIERQLALLNKMNDDSPMMVDCMGDMGLSLRGIDKDNGLDYLLKAKKMAQKQKMKIAILVLDNTITNRFAGEQPFLELQVQECLYETAERKIYRDSVALVMVAYHVGTKSKEIKEYEKAITYLDLADSLMKATNNPHKKLITKLPIEKLECYSAMGNKEQFVKAVQHAIQVFYQTTLDVKVSETGLYSSIGNNYLPFDADSSLFYLNKAYQILTLNGTLNPDSMDQDQAELLAKIYNGQANALLEKGNSEKAIVPILESIKIFTGVDDQNNPNFTCNEQDDYALIETYLIASDVFTHYLKHHADEKMLQMGLKTFYCCDTIMRRLAINISDQDAILNFAKEYKGMTENLLDIPTITSKNPEIAFHFVSKSKGYQLMADINRHVFSEKFSKEDTLWNAKNEITETLRLTQEEKKRATKIDQTELLDSLANIEKDLLVDLIVVNYRIIQNQKNLDNYFEDDNVLKIAQNMVDDSSMLVDIYQTQKKAYLFCLNKSGLTCVEIQNSEKLDILATQFYKEVKTGGDFENTAKALSNMLLNPILDKITASKTLTIIPDNVLYQIPFELLTNPKTGKILLYSHAISYHYSTSLWIKSQGKKASTTNTLLAIAPVFENAKSGTLAENFRGKYLEDPYLQKMTRENITPLPFTLLEINDLSKLFSSKGISNTKLTNNLATKESFFDQAKNYSILHIATHGYVSKTTPSNSGFFLYSNNNGIDLLNVGELFNLNTTADLVVLSACNSGVGPIYEGEGVMALPRGFIYAGVPNVMASLWKVHDAKTKELMLFFYTHLLNGNTYSQALQKAKLDCIQKGFLPLDWAGFVLIGR